MLKPLIIGERINPTGRKVLAQELRDGSFIRVKRDALDQVEAGADILDVNMGVAGMDQNTFNGKSHLRIVHACRNAIIHRYIGSSSHGSSS